MIYDNIKRNDNIIVSVKPSVHINYIDGPFVEIKGGHPQKFFVEFIDRATGNIEHSGTITNNCWIKANKKYYIDWLIKINGEAISEKNNDVIFSICTRCETDEHCQLPIRCANSIKQIYPDAEIIIIDSDSPCKNHFPRLIELGCIVSEYKNLHYEAGAMWYTYDKIIRKTYVFLQDSMVLNGKIDNFLEKEFTLIGGVEKEWSCATEQHIMWVKDNIKKSDYEFMEKDFYILQYNSMIISRDLLTKLKNKNLDKVLPVSKVGSCGTERIFGMALTQEGYVLDENLQLPQNLITKNWMDRQ